MSDLSEPSRIRITFAKTDALRFVGHLDLAKTWERVLRRAQVSLVYSRGFNPQPKMQLATALPLGVSSECELLDMWLAEQTDLQTLPDLLNRVSPPGLRSLSAEMVPLKSPALQTLVESAEYLLAVDDPEDPVLNSRIDAFLKAEQVLRERKGKVYNLRALVHSVEHAVNGAFQARLATGDQGNARPDEFLDALGLDASRVRCHRTALHLRPIVSEPSCGFDSEAVD